MRSDRIKFSLVRTRRILTWPFGPRDRVHLNPIIEIRFSREFTIYSLLFSIPATSHARVGLDPRLSIPTYRRQFYGNWLLLASQPTTPTSTPTTVAEVLPTPSVPTIKHILWLITIPHALPYASVGVTLHLGTRVFRMSPEFGNF
uniref:Uncharacterized protein n=1 Tax=Morchella importuna TaxID=1174673 RepID=A0A650AF41_9PEZI|nr:hypothetical protein [Morchella importuna]QGN66642.1 hypothetical protein [Morchella importuna]